MLTRALARRQAPAHRRTAMVPSVDARRYSRAMSASLRSFAAAAAAALAGAMAPAAAQDAAPTRGQLLYETHCVECHNQQMHWRDNSQVRDWAGLLVQVGRWQAAAGLAWSVDDIEAVARFLNEAIYQLPQPERRAAR